MDYNYFIKRTTAAMRARLGYASLSHGSILNSEQYYGYIR
jgi:hypothetical protein